MHMQMIRIRYLPHTYISIQNCLIYSLWRWSIMNGGTGLIIKLEKGAPSLIANVMVLNSSSVSLRIGPHPSIIRKRWREKGWLKCLYKHSDQGTGKHGALKACISTKRWVQKLKGMFCLVGNLVPSYLDICWHMCSYTLALVTSM